MITKSRINQIMTIALPIMGGMVTANLLTLADTIMVGRLGKNAIAAVGVAGFAITLVFATFSGLAGAVQAITARRAGEGKPEEATHGIHGGLAISLIVGLGVPAIGIPLVPLLFPYLSSDPEVIKFGVPYMQVSLLGLLGSCINTTFTGYWNGLGKTARYTAIMMISHFVNIALNYLLIFGIFNFEGFGVVGAALATLASIYLSTAAYFWLLIKEKPPNFLKILPDTTVLKRMLSLMVPMSIRSIFQYSGYLVFSIIVGKIGTTELAATSILVRIMLITVMPVFGLGLGGGTLAGQKLGAKDPEAAAEWGWDTAKLGAMILALVGVPLVLFPQPVLHLMINDLETVQLATVPLQIIGFSRPLYVVLIFASLLVTVGDVKRPTYYQLSIQWLLFLPAVWYLGLLVGVPFYVIWLLEVANITLQLMILAKIWQQRRWQRIAL